MLNRDPYRGKACSEGLVTPSISSPRVCVMVSVHRFLAHVLLINLVVTCKAG